MSENTTMAEQAAAFTTVAGLASRYPELPAAYICIHSSFVCQPEVNVQAQSFSDLEAWREALGGDVMRVGCYPLDRGAALQFSVDLDGVTVKVYAVDRLVSEIEVAA
ncbi:hypothetical protein J7I98_14515 [Streptomyces sp. ISL-98]|uniref:hypothetical protein n=1 Tax=Streptomyces sp. ISL-98 TaxID=2819192 RepID=UPI001BEACB08|nr:hypothetical protein [Streptomyces sp. ISL-98]MBT2507079.1 hypothetical protein [Streptomyces sp. ISL-98]